MVAPRCGFLQIQRNAINSYTVNFKVVNFHEIKMFLSEMLNVIKRWFQLVGYGTGISTTELGPSPMAFIGKEIVIIKLFFFLNDKFP